MTRSERSLARRASLMLLGGLALLGSALEGGARAAPRECARSGPRDPGCFESCALAPAPGLQASAPLVAKLRAIAPGGVHALSELRVASIPLEKEAAARWRQNGLWAGPCAGLAAAFQAKAGDGRDPGRAVDVYQLRYTSEAAARRVAALLETSWNWNGHPFIVVRRGPDVNVVEGRYGAWSALEAVGARLGGSVYPRTAPVPLALCDPRAKPRPLFRGGGLTVHVLGFAPSGELAWLEERGGAAGVGAWTLRVTNLVNDRESAARTYQTKEAGIAAFCRAAQADAGRLLRDHAIGGAGVTAFDAPSIDGGPVRVTVEQSPAGETRIVMHGPAGTKVLGLAAAGARPLGLLQSPFEERVAALILDSDAGGRPALRVLGGRLDKRWLPALAQKIARSGD
jgi:hypothetical protein